MAVSAPPKPEEAEATQASNPEPNPAKGELFDRTIFDDPELRIEKVDDKDVDKIRIDFAGSVLLERKNPADVALFNRLRLGKEVELRVGGVCSASNTGFTTGREGDLDAVVGKKRVSIDTVHVLAPEEL